MPAIGGEDRGRVQMASTASIQLLLSEQCEDWWKEGTCRRSWLAGETPQYLFW